MKKPWSGSSTIWFEPSRILWWPSTIVCNRAIYIDWLKWKTILFFDDCEVMPELPNLGNVLGWIGVALLLFFTFALWMISEGMWTR